MNVPPDLARRSTRALALVACAVLVIAACGDDGDSEASLGDATDTTVAPDEPTPQTTMPATTTESAAPTTAAATTTAAASTTEATSPPTTAQEAATTDEPPVCEPFLQVSTAFAGEPDPTTIRALLDDVDANAPDEIADELSVLTTNARTVLETGDFSVFESREFASSVAVAESWMSGNCVFVTQTEIIAADYRYEGQAARYPAGRTAITLINEGAEAHEILLLRKNDGVELSLEELLGLPESEAETMTTYVAGVFVGPPGATGNLVVDLQSGDYIAVCNIPAGTFVAPDGTVTEGAGEPHVMLGMSFEFTVT